MPQKIINLTIVNADNLPDGSQVVMKKQTERSELKISEDK